MTNPTVDWAPLVDLTEARLADLLAAGAANPALTRSLRRLVSTLDDPDGVISAFSSFAE